MKTALRTIIGIASVCIWIYAAYFALKWFGHMVGGTISYNGRTSAVVVPALSGLVLLGAVCAVILFIMARYGIEKRTPRSSTSVIPTFHTNKLVFISSARSTTESKQQNIFCSCVSLPPPSKPQVGQDPSAG
jgi:hypothetical protein